jgi:hypothetical protein
MLQKPLFLVFGLILFGIFQAKSQNIKTNEEDEITKEKAYIIHDALNGKMPSNDPKVECSTFLQRDDLDTFDLTNFRGNISDLFCYPMKRFDSFDVNARAELLIWYKSGKVDTICTGRTRFFMINGTVYRSDLMYFGGDYPYSDYIHLARSKIAK